MYTVKASRFKNRNGFFICRNIKKLLKAGN